MSHPSELFKKGLAHIRQRAVALGARDAWERLQKRLMPRTKEAVAAQFFVESFGRLSSTSMDALVERYWHEYRRLALILAQTGLQRSDESLRLLDVGGGYSTVLRLFATEQSWVLDICTDELYAAGLPMPTKPSFLRGAAERVPFPSGFFHAVFCTNVLDHVEDPAAAVAEIHRALRPGGFFILLVDLFHDPEHQGHGQRDLLHPHNLSDADIRGLVSERFDLLLHTTQSGAGGEPSQGKVGLGMLARGQITPHTDRAEHIFVFAKREV